MIELLSEKDIPKEYIKEIKKWSGDYRFVTGRIDEYMGEFKILVSIWEDGGAYKIIRVFLIIKRNKPITLVDSEMLNSDDIMAKLLMEY